MDPDSWKSYTPEQREAILSGPAGRIPPGVDSRFGNLPSSDALMLSVITISLVLVTFCMLVRIYAKTFLTKAWRVEDVFGLIAFGTYLGGVWCLLRLNGLNAMFVHQWDLEMRDFLKAAFPLFIIRLFYAFTMLFIKTAILLDWLRIFVPTGIRNWFFWSSWTLLTIDMLFYAASIMLIALGCRPIAVGWTPMKRGTCLDINIRRDYDFSSAAVNLLLDVAILLLPQRIIWRLNMPSQKKVAVSIAFSIGILACACAVGRVVSGQSLRRTEDQTWDASPALLWAFSEMTCAFLIFCAPMAPKILSASTQLTQLAHSLRSWSRIVGTRGSNASGRSNRSNRTGRSDHSNRNEAQVPGIYQRIEDSSVPLPMPHSTLSATGDKHIPLAQMQTLNKSQDVVSQATTDTAPLKESRW